MSPSFPNAPEPKTVSSLILFHCWTEFGGRVASTAWLVNTTRMARATPNIKRLNRRDFMELSFLIRTSDVGHSRRHKPRCGCNRKLRFSEHQLHLHPHAADATVDEIAIEKAGRQTS